MSLVAMVLLFSKFGLLQFINIHTLVYKTVNHSETFLSLQGNNKTTRMIKIMIIT